jgi:hypothetical protein
MKRGSAMPSATGTDDTTVHSRRRGANGWHWRWGVRAHRLHPSIHQANGSIRKPLQIEGEFRAFLEVTSWSGKSPDLGFEYIEMT